MRRAWHGNFQRAKKELRMQDGITFDSMSEMRRYRMLRLEQRIGHIRSLKCHVIYPLVLPDGTKIMVGRQRARYTADFVYEEKTGGAWSEVIEDHKGHMDRASKFRIAVFEAIYKVKVRITAA